MKIIYVLSVLMLCLTHIAYSKEDPATKTVLDESTTNSMVDTQAPILKEEEAPSSSPEVIADIPFTTPPGAETENTNSIDTPPVVETKPESVEVEIKQPEEENKQPEIKTPAKTEPKTKIEQINPSSGNSNFNVVNIVSTADGKTVFAQLSVTEEPNGVLIQGTFKGVPDPGNHGIHIHENGSCAEKGDAAGGHFNPDNRPHGNLAHRGHAEAHAGDMGNVEIDDKGNGSFKFLLGASSLHEGRYNVAGKAIILHEKADDFGQPTGNAGGRIGCGVIPNP